VAVETVLTPDQEAEVARQLAIIRRGTAEIVPEDELVQKLRESVRTGRPLRVKLGIDPTSSDIHLGHTVVLHKLRQFQDLGHQVFLVIGSFTGQIGDPTDKAETRKQLSAEEVAENAKTYVAQLYKILDPEKTQVVYNGDWLAPLDFAQVIRLASTITVARMLEREDFQKRFQDNRPIHVHEFFYPLMQAYDSVHLRADVELGGTDQKFNLLMGRHLQREFGQPMQVAVMLPLLEGLDGVNKMSKSLGNYIGLNEEPNNMFGKLMSVPDSLLFKYYELLSLRPQDEIEAMRREVEAGRMNPRDAKMQLAEELVERFLGPEARREAVEHWRTVFQKGGLPDDIPERRVAGEAQWIVKWLVDLGLAQSNSDARRAIQEGAVRLNGNKVTDTDFQYRPQDGDVLQRGKRQFVRLRTE